MNDQINFEGIVFTDANGVEVPYDGSDVSWRVSVYALVVQANTILLVKNKKEKLYDLPGGGLRMDEEIVEAIMREGLEEAGARVRVGPLVDYHQDYFFHKGAYYRTLLLFFEASLIGSLGVPTDEQMEAAHFYAMDEMRKLPMLDYVKKTITNYCNADATERA